MADAQFDPYRVLGLAPEAPDFVVQATYRAFLKKFHPDVYSGVDAAARTAEVIEAFKILGNPASRANFDRVAGHVAGSRDAASAPPSAPSSRTRPGGWSAGTAVQQGLVEVENGIRNFGITLIIMVTLFALATALSDSGDDEETLEDAMLDTVEMPADEAIDYFERSPAFNYEDAASSWSSEGGNTTEQAGNAAIQAAEDAAAAAEAATAASEVENLSPSQYYD